MSRNWVRQIACFFSLALLVCLGSHSASAQDDGNLAFISTRSGSTGVFIMDANGALPVGFSPGAQIEGGAAWSPDGRLIAFLTRAAPDADWDIVVLSADGSNRRQLTDNDSTDAEVAWSPDSQRIAFVSTRDGNAEVYVMNADGSNPVNLTQNASADHFPAWSPDGQRIAFVSERDGNLEVYVMNADGSNPVNLTNSPGDDTLPLWQPASAEALSAAPPAADAPATLPPTAVVVPTAAPANLCILEAITDTNTRSGPGTSFERVGLFAGGAKFEADGQFRPAGSLTWYHLPSDEWIRADLVREEARCADVPTLSP